MKFAMFKRLTSPLPYVWPIVYEQMLFITLRCHFDEEIVKKNKGDYFSAHTLHRSSLNKLVKEETRSKGNNQCVAFFYVVSTSSRILWHRRVMKSTITLVSLDYSHLVLLVSILSRGRSHKIAHYVGSQDCSGLCCWIWPHIADIHAVPPLKFLQTSN